MYWSGGAQPEATELLADVSNREDGAILVEGWSVSWSETGDYASLGRPGWVTRIDEMAVEFHGYSRGWTTLTGSHGLAWTDRFVVRFTYKFQAPSSGDCTFTCTADDRCTLFVDGALVVKTTRNVYRETSGTLSLVGMSLLALLGGGNEDAGGDR